LSKCVNRIDGAKLHFKNVIEKNQPELQPDIISIYDSSMILQE